VLTPHARIIELQMVREFHLVASLRSMVEKYL
jgi:hypothetical protein